MLLQEHHDASMTVSNYTCVQRLYDKDSTDVLIAQANHIAITMSYEAQPIYGLAVPLMHRACYATYESSM